MSDSPTWSRNVKFVSISYFRYSSKSVNTVPSEALNSFFFVLLLPSMASMCPLLCGWVGGWVGFIHSFCGECYGPGRGVHKGATQRAASTSSIVLLLLLLCFLVVRAARGSGWGGWMVVYSVHTHTNHRRASWRGPLPPPPQPHTRRSVSKRPPSAPPPGSAGSTASSPCPPCAWVARGRVGGVVGAVIQREGRGTGTGKEGGSATRRFG